MLEKNNTILINGFNKCQIKVESPFKDWYLVFGSGNYSYMEEIKTLGFTSETYKKLFSRQTSGVFPGCRDSEELEKFLNHVLGESNWCVKGQEDKQLNLKVGDIVTHRGNKGFVAQSDVTNKYYIVFAIDDESIGFSHKNFEALFNKKTLNSFPECDTLEELTKFVTYVKSLDSPTKEEKRSLVHSLSIGKTYVYFINRGIPPIIFKLEKVEKPNLVYGPAICRNEEYYPKSCTYLSEYEMLQEATPMEVTHLEQCIKANKYVEYCEEKAIELFPTPRVKVGDYFVYNEEFICCLLNFNTRKNIAYIKPKIEVYSPEGSISLNHRGKTRKATPLEIHNLKKCIAANKYIEPDTELPKINRMWNLSCIEDLTHQQILEGGIIRGRNSSTPKPLTYSDLERYGVYHIEANTGEYLYKPSANYYMYKDHAMIWGKMPISEYLEEDDDKIRIATLEESSIFVHAIKPSVTMFPTIATVIESPVTRQSVKITMFPNIN